MIKLYQNDKLYSNSKIKNSTLIEIPSASYFGCKLKFDSYHRPEIHTLCDKVFRLTTENLDLLIKSTTVLDGTIHNSLTWQPYKRKYFLLPNNILDASEPVYGDIVKPLLEKNFYPSKMIYLGKLNLVKYDPHGKKTVYKDQHVFAGLDDRFNKLIITHPKIDSAFINVSKNVEMADELLQRLNFESSLRTYNYEDPSVRVFYLNEFKSTNIVPKLVKLDGQVLAPINNYTTYMENFPTMAVRNNTNTYIIHSSVKSLISRGLGQGFKIDDLEIIDISEDELESYHILYPFKIKKMGDYNLIDIPVDQSYEYYMVVYELYQDGKLIGRK